MNKNVLIWMPVLLLVFASCKPGKKLARKDKVSDSTIVVADTAAIPQPQTDIVDLKADGHIIMEEVAVDTANIAPAINSEFLVNNATAFNTFKGKAKMNYGNGNMGQEFTANIRMAKDSIIWIHITAGMGLVNVARILITPDSFRMVNYLDKSGLALHISEANQLLPAEIDFEILQSFIIGEIFKTPHQQVMRTRDAGNFWTVDISGLNTNQLANINKADTTLQTLQVMSSDDGFSGVIYFADYTLVNSRKFSTSRTIDINSANQLHHLDMNFNNASFDEEIDFPFVIPDSYTLNK